MEHEALKKVNKTNMSTKWTPEQQFVIDELESYPFMLTDARRLFEEMRQLADRRLECDMPAMVHRYDSDPIQRTGVSDPMHDIVAATESIDRKMDELRTQQENLLTRHTRITHDLTRLTPSQAAVIRLRHFDRYRWTQIQDRLNCGETQIGRIHERAIERMTYLMSDILSRRNTENGGKRG